MNEQEWVPAEEIAHRAVDEFECPTCGARPALPCIDQQVKGYQRYTARPHPARVDEARSKYGRPRQPRTKPNRWAAFTDDELGEIARTYYDASTSSERASWYSHDTPLTDEIQAEIERRRA